MAPWLVIRKVRDDLGAFKASAREGGQISAPTVGFCGRLYIIKAELGLGAGLVIQLPALLLP